MVEALNGKGTVLIIDHPGVTSVRDRITGFKEILAGYPDITIAAIVPAWGQKERAMIVMEDMLLKIPDIKGIFGINDDCALGAAVAVENAGKKAVVIGYDATPAAKQAIEDGLLYGDAVQYPDRIGILAVRMIADFFSGKKVPPIVPVEVGVWKKGSK